METKQLSGRIGAITGTKQGQTLGMWTQMGKCIVRMMCISTQKPISQARVPRIFMEQ